MTTTTEAPVQADDAVLTPKLSARWALAPVHLAFVGFWCLFFLLLSYIPLRNTDLWGHAAYGQWMLEHKTLPDEDPFQPLAVGMKVVDSAWLSQLVFAVAENVGGYEALSALFAVTTLATFLVLSRVFILQSRLLPITIVSLLITIALGWSRIATIRPENFAALCFAVLLWLVVRSEPQGKGGQAHFAPKTPQSEPVPDSLRQAHFAPKTPQSEPVPDSLRLRSAWTLWLGVGLVMAVWANLHGSFVCGLAVLVCCLLGRVAEAAWQTRNWATIVADPGVRSWLYAFEIGILATLLNPYGIDLLLYTLLFSGNANVKDVLEWQPLVILGTGGREFALSWVMLAVVLRYSRRRIPVSHVLMLGLFSLAVVSGVRMLTWYAAIFALVITPHLAYLARRYLPDSWLGGEDQPRLDKSQYEGLALPQGRRWSYSMVALLVVWICFAMAPISRPVLGGDPRSATEVLDAATPLAISEHLLADPPSGQVFNPQWWGDWLVWDGPDTMKPFVTTNIHLVPRQVWEDYHIILGARSGWQRALERYNVETIVVDKQRQTVLTALLRRSSSWRITFEDEQGMIVRKRTDAQTSDTENPDAPSDSTEQVQTSPRSHLNA